MCRRPPAVLWLPRGSDDLSETADHGARAYHHGDLRKALLEAARGIVEQEGLDAFTLRECARRAGVSHGAPAHHFTDRTGLLTALAVQALEERVAAAEARMAAAGPDPLDRLKACGLAQIEFNIRRPRLDDLCSHNGVTDHSDPAMQAVFQKMTAALVDAMSAATGQPMKPEKEANPETLLALVVVTGFAKVFNDGMILRDVPERERFGRALALASDLLDLLDSAFRGRGVSGD